jgi:hypothetical protein
MAPLHKRPRRNGWRPLVLATTQGKLQLVMRNYGDQEAAQTIGAKRRLLMLSAKSYYFQTATLRLTEVTALLPLTTSR